MPCSSCRHLLVTERHGKGVVGRCRRYPPILVELPVDKREVYLQPTVRGSDHCGEYAAGQASKAFRVHETPPYQEVDDGLPF